MRKKDDSELTRFLTFCYAFNHRGKSLEALKEAFRDYLEIAETQEGAFKIPIKQCDSGQITVSRSLKRCH